MLKHIGLNCCLLSLFCFPLASQGESIKDPPNDIQSANNIRGKLLFKTPDPKTALEHNNRGIEYGKIGLWVNAIKEHSLALLEDPTNKIFRTNLSSAHLQYGDVLLKKGELLEAKAQFHAALYVDPDNKTAAAKLNGRVLVFPDRPKVQVPGELDQFLKDKTNTLHGYDAF